MKLDQIHGTGKRVPNKRNFIVSATTWLKSQHFPKLKASSFLKYILNF